VLTIVVANVLAVLVNFDAEAAARGNYTVRQALAAQVHIMCLCRAVPCCAVLWCTVAWCTVVWCVIPSLVTLRRGRVCDRRTPPVTSHHSSPPSSTFCMVAWQADLAEREAGKVRVIMAAVVKAEASKKNEKWLGRVLGGVATPMVLVQADGTIKVGVAPRTPRHITRGAQAFRQCAAVAPG